MPEESAFTSTEMMALAAGRLVQDGDVVFAGTGVSMLAATVAKRLFAPHCAVFFETGGIDPALDEMPMAVADSRVMSGTSVNSGLLDAFSIVGHRKLRTLAFLGAAQIDPFGNLNTTCLGDYQRPTVRFAGSGGACDVAALASAFVVFVSHERRRFVEQLDYLTSVGWYRGGNSRRELGYSRGGPLAVVTNLGVLAFENASKRMHLAFYYPGVKIATIVEQTGFALDVTNAQPMPAPNADELKVLRDEIDPQRLIL